MSNHEYNEGTGSKNTSLISGLVHSLGSEGGTITIKNRKFWTLTAIGAILVDAGIIIYWLMTTTDYHLSNEQNNSTIAWSILGILSIIGFILIILAFKYKSAE